MKSARELIVEVGWNSVTTRGLAERARVRPGLVHYHFESLADALHKAAISEVTRFIDTQLDSDGSIVEAESAADLQTFPMDFDGSDSMPVLLIETYLAAIRDSGLADELNEQLDRYRSAMTTAFEQAGTVEPRATTLVVLAALDGLVLQKRLDPSLRIDDAVALLQTFISRKGE